MEETLKDKTAKGIFWGGMSNGLQQLLNLIFGIFLGRLLTQSDYGMVGMLTIFSLIASTLQESGFTAALAIKKQVTHEEYNAVFWFNVLTGGALYLILFACAPLIAQFYQQPELTALARYAFLGFFLTSLGTVHYAVLFREMKVKQRTIATFTALCISGTVGVTMAFLGFRYWGIATQNLCYILITNSFFWYYSRWRPTLQWNFRPAFRMFGMSSKILATNIFNHINNNLFSVFLGRFYGDYAVGNYTQGNKWNTMGNNLISGMVNGVAQPVLAQVKEDAERQCRVFRKMLRFTSFTTFPVMLGLALVARELITILITERWLESAEILSILCWSGAFLPITNLYSNLIISKGKSGIYLWNTIAISLLQFAALLLLYPYGIHTMLYVYVILNIAWLLVWHHFVGREIPLRLHQALLDILPFLLTAAVVMWCTGWATASVDNLYLRFTAKVGLAAVLYLGIMAAARVEVMNEMWKYLSRFRPNSRRATPSPEDHPTAPGKKP